jgi:cardiolipin synthase
MTGALEREFMETLACSREVSLDEMDARPLREKIRDGAAKLFSPYL